MNLLASVTTIMTKNPVTLSPNDTVSAASHLFATMKIHHIPVLDGGKLVGILSKSDFVFFKRGFNDDEIDKKLTDIRLNNYKVSSIMTTGLAKLDSTDRINVALDIFNINIFHALPVLENGRLIGIITTHDIIKSIVADNGTTSSYK